MTLRDVRARARFHVLFVLLSVRKGRMHGFIHATTIRRTLEGSLHILRSDNFDVIDGPAGVCETIRWSIKPCTS